MQEAPSSTPGSTFPAAPLLQDNLVVSPTKVKKAVMSFPAGSAGGPDGLLPQHLKDLVSPTLGEVGASFVEALASFVSQLISGNVSHPVAPFFFGARLLGLNKPDGGVRPIAVGRTLRRLAAKCLGNSVFEEMDSLLFPLQVGYGTRLGAEGAVHAARAYLTQLHLGNLMLKLDFQNAFNSIRRDVILKEVLVKAPKVYPLAYSAYRFPSFLLYGNSTILSTEGVQQGDPLGPLLFCLGIHDLISSLQSQFRVFYLDDGTLGGTLDEVSADLALIESQAPLLGLILNQAKSEVICANKDTMSSILTSFPALHPSDPRHAILLRSPIGGIEAIEDTIKAKVADLQRLGERLPLLEAHDSLCLLLSAFAIPKVLYILRTAPCFLSPSLDHFDSLQRSLIESICNIELSDASWLQASLPINGGGLGIRSVAMLAPLAYLASAAGSAPISQAILPAGMTPSLPSIQAQALVKWGKWVDESVKPPIGVAATKQKT